MYGNPRFLSAEQQASIRAQLPAHRQSTVCVLVLSAQQYRLLKMVRVFGGHSNLALRSYILFLREQMCKNVNTEKGLYGRFYSTKNSFLLISTVQLQHGECLVLP